LGGTTGISLSKTKRSHGEQTALALPCEGGEILQALISYSRTGSSATPENLYGEVRPVTNISRRLDPAKFNYKPYHNGCGWSEGSREDKG
jgi:hypothetical protein